MAGSILFFVSILSLGMIVAVARSGSAVCDDPQAGSSLICRSILGPFFGHFFAYIDFSYPAYGVIFGSWIVYVYRNLAFSVKMGFLVRQLNYYPSINIALSIVITYIILRILKQGILFNLGGFETSFGNSTGLLTPGPSFLIGLVVATVSEKVTRNLLDYAGVFSDRQFAALRRESAHAQKE